MPRPTLKPPVASSPSSRRPPAQATALPGAPLERQRMVPDPTHSPFDPGPLADAVLRALVLQHPWSLPVQWVVRLEWDLAARHAWTARAEHARGRTTGEPPYVAEAGSAEEALLKLQSRVLRGAR